MTVIMIGQRRSCDQCHREQDVSAEVFSGRKSALRREGQRACSLTLTLTTTLLLGKQSLILIRTEEIQKQGHQSSRETKLHQNSGGPIYTGIRIRQSDGNDAGGGGSLTLHISG